MKNLFFKLIALHTVILLMASCNQINSSTLQPNRATMTLDSIITYYGVENSHLFRETFPFESDYNATYLATASTTKNQYSYLWPFSGVLTATSVLIEADNSHTEFLEQRVLPGLESYMDTTRQPISYASYINSASPSDRFYDDNVWLGIDFCDLYMSTQNPLYLKKAELIWKFIESGIDSLLGGGIYWCEQKKDSKNTCSNAPGAVYALKLYNATNNERYLTIGAELYNWTKTTLIDRNDNLYFDNMNLEGDISKVKYAYNSGQMIQAGAMLYNITHDRQYLEDAQKTAASCNAYFFEPIKSHDNEFRILKNGNVWFSSVMVRGFIELYEVDKNSEYIDNIESSLNYAWRHGRDQRGLFGNSFKETQNEQHQWLLTQFAFVEMYSRISNLQSHEY